MWRAGAFTLVMSPLILQEIVAKLLEKGIAEELLEELVFYYWSNRPVHPRRLSEPVQLDEI